MGEETKTPPQTGVEQIQGSLDSLSFFTFLVHPDQRPLSEYKGEIPANFRESLYGLAQTAEMFGFDADFNGDVTQMIGTLTPAMLVDILKGIDKDAFVNIWENNPEIKDILTSLAQPIIASEMPNMSLQDANSMFGVTIAWGETLGAFSISDASDPIKLQDSISNMSNEDTLALLNSLPDELKTEVIAKLGQDENGIPLDGFDLSGKTIKDAILARAEFSEANAGFLGVLGLFNDKSQTADTSINKVYDSIRAALPEKIAAEIQTRITTTADIDPGKLHELMTAKLTGDPDSILNLLTEDKMKEIRYTLTKMKDHSFLINLLPDSIKDEALFNKVRETMDQFGILGPVGQIIMQLANFVIGMAQSHLPGLIGQEKADGVIAKLQSFANPEAPQQPVVEPHLPPQHEAPTDSIAPTPFYTHGR